LGAANEKEKSGIQEFLIRHMVFIAFVSFGLLLFIRVFNEYSDFSSESKLLREEHQNAKNLCPESRRNFETRKKCKITGSSE
jgi:hypothetical protein